MANHILKEDPEQFKALLKGQRLFEIRVNDRGFSAYDHLLLVVTKFSSDEMKAGAPLLYTGLAIKVEVISVNKNIPGVCDGWCVLELAENWDLFDDFSPDNPAWTEWAANK